MDEIPGVAGILSSPETRPFREVSERLSELSVRKRYEAHSDIHWDAPEMRIESGDPRWEATADWDPLAHCDWYRDQSPERRSDIGLYRQVRLLKTVIAFESTFIEGLLRFAARLPNRHPAFRYVYHEITEEAQHIMMFQEVINRSGIDVPNPSDVLQQLVTRFADMGEVDTALFFLALLSGEEAFDYLQRQSLRITSTHPLVATTCRIHVTEEARHLSFAREVLRALVPRLDNRQLRVLRFEAPIVLGRTAAFMFASTAASLDDWGVPAEVIDDLSNDPRSSDIRRRSLSRVVALCRDLDVVDNRLGTVWSRIGSDTRGVRDSGFTTDMRPATN